MPEKSKAKEDKAKASPLISLTAGGVAGGVETAITYPFEFAKTRVQLHDASVPRSRNPFAVISDVVRKEGPRALYTGCSILIVGSIGKDALRFLSFDAIKAQFADPETGNLTAGRNLVAGMCAGVVASTFAVTPTERIKTAMIDDARSSATRQFTSPAHTIRMLVREKGLTSLYAGYATTTLKQAGSTSTRLGSYNILKQMWESYGVTQGAMMNFVNGATAGTITVYATQPFDVVKTRAQSAKGAGTWEATTSVWNDFGVKGFWRGSTMRLGRNVFSGAILFSVYEQVTAALKVLMPQKDKDL